MFRKWFGPYLLAGMLVAPIAAQAAGTVVSGTQPCSCLCVKLFGNQYCICACPAPPPQSTI